VILDLPREKGGNTKKVFAEKARQLPGVADMSFQYEGPMHEGHMNDKIVYKGKTIIETDVESNYTDDRFIPLYNIKMVAGRNMQKTDSLREIVINQNFSKILGFKNPSDALNQFIVYREKPYAIVGVTADFHQSSFHSSIRPSIVVFAPWVNNIAIKIALNTDLKKTIAGLEKIYRSIYPEKKFQYKFYDESIAKLYEKESQTAELMNTATFIAIFISCIGLFGLATFTARQRTKEIGIRKVLGATVSNIMFMLSKDFVKLVLIALVIASPIAWYFMNNWLQDFVYRINIGGLIFLVAGSMAVVIAIITVSYQAIKAAIANPVNTLRNE
jgi:ABC-type antimicrobial peptide transport system permease subunit